MDRFFYLGSKRKPRHELIVDNALFDEAKEYATLSVNHKIELPSILSGTEESKKSVITNFNIPKTKNILVSNCKKVRYDTDINSLIYNYTNKIKFIGFPVYRLSNLKPIKGLEFLENEWDVFASRKSCHMTPNYKNRIIKNLGASEKILGYFHTHLKRKGRIMPSTYDLLYLHIIEDQPNIGIHVIMDKNYDIKIFGFDMHVINSILDYEDVEPYLNNWIYKNYDDFLFKEY